MKFKLAFIGFGTVGQGLAQILVEKKGYLKRRFDFEYDVTAISDIRTGAVFNGKGLDLQRILYLVNKNGTINGYGLGNKGLSSLETIRESNADIIIEVTWTDLEKGEPGLTHIRESLTAHKHVVTTNKGPIALAYHELKRTAEKRNVLLRFEGTVLSGTPAITLAAESLAGARIDSIRGILNVTTNYILTEMENGKNYEEAVKEAQKLGYAESDPTMDVEGWDAAAKVTILANASMGGNVNVKKVRRTGITQISDSDVKKACREKKRLKLIAEMWRADGRIKTNVSPQMIPSNDMFAHINGNLNALTVSTDVLKEVTVVGPGAGGIEAGYAILSDMLAIDRYLKTVSRT